MTCDASQGLSLGDRIYVHDWRSHMADHEWVRTAVSRCGTLDIILVNGSTGLTTNFIDIGKRLAGHLAADRAKQFVWDEKDYITSEWIKNRLSSQHSSCSLCREPLDIDWSVDRIDNTLPHIKDNCHHLPQMPKRERASAHIEDSPRPALAVVNTQAVGEAFDDVYE